MPAMVRPQSGSESDGLFPYVFVGICVSCVAVHMKNLRSQYNDDHSTAGTSSNSFMLVSVEKTAVPLSSGYSRSVLENKKSQVSNLGISILGKEDSVGILIRRVIARRLRVDCEDGDKSRTS